MFEITIPEKSKKENAYLVYDEQECIITISEDITCPLISAPKYYNIESTKPLVFRNMTPVMINKEKALDFINESPNSPLNQGDFTPFGFKISKEEFLQLKEIAKQTNPNEKYFNDENEFKQDLQAAKKIIKKYPNKKLIDGRYIIS